MPVNPAVFRPDNERKLLFQGKEIATADLRDGKGYVSVRSLCEAFGLDQRAQRRRLMRQQGYFEPYTATVLMNTTGGPQPTLCLMCSAVPIFLTGVELDRLQDVETRDLLRAFLDEAHTILAEHFGISERGEQQFMRESIARMVAEQELFEDKFQKKVEAELTEIRNAHEEKIQQNSRSFCKPAPAGDAPGNCSRTQSAPDARAAWTAPPAGSLPGRIITGKRCSQALSWNLYGCNSIDRRQPFRRYSAGRFF